MNADVVRHNRKKHTTGLYKAWGGVWRGSFMICECIDLGRRLRVRRVLGVAGRRRAPEIRPASAALRWRSAGRCSDRWGLLVLWSPDRGRWLACCWSPAGSSDRWLPAAGCSSWWPWTRPGWSRCRVGSWTVASGSCSRTWSSSPPPTYPARLNYLCV